MKIFRFSLIVLVFGLLSIMSCNGDRSKDGMILTNTQTGKKYLLRWSVGDVYFVTEGKPVVIGNDTTLVFSNHKP